MKFEQEIAAATAALLGDENTYRLLDESNVFFAREDTHTHTRTRTHTHTHNFLAAFSRFLHEKRVKFTTIFVRKTHKVYTIFVQKLRKLCTSRRRRRQCRAVSILVLSFFSSMQHPFSCFLGVSSHSRSCRF